MSYHNDMPGGPVGAPWIGQQGSTMAVELHTLAASLDPARQFCALQRKIGRAWGWECGQDSGREELALKSVICGDPRCEGSSTLD